jgi:WD40 repeat protein
VNPERYRRLDELFRGALALPEAERAAWLTERCRGDAELRSEVEELIAHDRAPRVTLADSPGRRLAAAAADLMEREGDALPPLELDGYRFLRPLGTGGMGVVWEAEQSHPPRRVAIKVLRPGLATNAMLRRFATEIRALARMDHPGIARIHDAGVAEGRGELRPYLVMELVLGKPLLEWAVHAGLSLRGRCELFARVADAVQGAHAKGVIHRDLKRSNVLVDGSGQPKVLDFGVARLVEGESAGALGSRATRTGQLVGSLDTMSPEQASGRPDAIDVRSDVYSLGCLLYELVAERPAFDFDDVPLPEAVRRIHEDEPPRLGSLDRRLAGDLETIVAKALAKDPRERYGSASELAADVRRYLEDLPILARPATTLYQLRKFARRHRAQAVGTSIALVFLALAFVAVLVFARREHLQRARAEETAAQLRQRLWGDSLAAARAALDGEDPAAAGAWLARLAPDEGGWERDWLAARAATATTRDHALNAQTYCLVRSGPDALLSGHRDGKVRRFDPATGEERGGFQVDGMVRCLAAADGLEHVVLVTEARDDSGRHEACLLRNGRLVRREPFVAPEGGIPLELDVRGGWVAFAPGGSRLVVWRLADGTTLHDDELDGGAITALALAPEGTSLSVAQHGDNASWAEFEPTTARILARHPSPSALTDLRWAAPDLLVARGVASLFWWHAGKLGELPLGTVPRALTCVVGTRRVLVGDDEGHILELDLAPGSEDAPHHRVRGGYGPITALCPLPEDGLVAAGFESGWVEFLDLGSGRPVMRHPPAHGGPIYALLAVPELDAVVAAKTNHVVVFGLPKAAFRELRHGSFVYEAVPLPALGLWATAAWDGELRFWDALDGSARGSFDLGEAGLGLCADPSGRRLFAVTKAGDARAFALDGPEGGVPIARSLWSAGGLTPSPPGSPIVFDPNGEVLACASRRELVLLRAVDGAEIRRADFSANILDLAPTAAGGALAVLTLEELLEVDPTTLGIEHARALPGLGTALAADGRGGWLIGCGDGSLLHYAARAAEPTLLGELGSEVMALALAPDGQRLAAGTRNGLVRLWRPDPWSPLLDLDPHVPSPRTPEHFYVRDLDWSSDGTSLISCSGDGTARVWDSRPRTR